MATLTFKKASSITYPLRMLLYGDSGEGKTYMAMLADFVEGMSPAVLVACDMGVSTARETDIAVLVLERTSQLSALLRAAESHRLPFKTIIIDGFSMYYDMLVYERSSGDAPSIRDWMTASVDVKKMMQRFVKADMNVIVTALAQKLQEESTGQFFTAPLLPGKMAWRFAEAFDIVGYVHTKATAHDVRRLMQVQPYKRVIAKDRGGTIGKVLVDITWQLGSSELSPMEIIWRRWRAYAANRSVEDEPSVPSVELTEDEVEFYESADPTLEGGETGIE